MIKYIVQHKREETFIIEVKCKVLTAMEDSSVGFQSPKEHRLKIIAPKSLYEGQNNKVMKPPIWWSFAFYDTYEKALDQAEKDIELSMRREAEKYNTEFVSSDYFARISNIKMIIL